MKDTLIGLLYISPRALAKELAGCVALTVLLFIVSIEPISRPIECVLGFSSVMAIILAMAIQLDDTPGSIPWDENFTPYIEYPDLMSDKSEAK